jgi:beta-lactam-binding protein with PASTA domain
MVSTAFGLGVDFGTSSTVAMLRWPDGRVKPLLFEGSPLLPSAVFAPSEGQLVVGSDALHHGRFEPSRLEPNPKRLIDDEGLLLGEREVSVAELFAAVLRHVATEAARVTGGVMPTTALAYPAGWGTVRRGALIDAAQSAGLGEVTLVPEPVAAADYFTRVLNRDVPLGQALVVYDLGAGTFDTSAVRRVASGFEVAAVDGLDDLGGLDLDAAIVKWLREGPAAGHDEQWNRLENPNTADDRRQRRMLWDDVRIAKEMLSRAPAVLVRLPALDLEVQFTRDEFEAVVQPLLARTVRTTGALIRYANLTQEDIAGLLLVGGASRVPLAATLLHRTLGIAPVATEQPELIVAEGALQSVAPAQQQAAVAGGAPVPGAPISGAPISSAPTSGGHGHPGMSHPTSGAAAAAYGPVSTPSGGYPVSTPPGGYPVSTPPGGYPVSTPPGGYPVSGPPGHGPVSGPPVSVPPGYPGAPVSPSSGGPAGVPGGAAAAGIGFAHPVHNPVGSWASVPTAPHSTVPGSAQGNTGTVYTGGHVLPPPEPLAPGDRDSRVIPVWNPADIQRPVATPMNPTGPAPAPAASLNQRPRRSPMKMIVAAITAVWIVIAGVVILLSLPDGDKAKVPNLAGVSQTDATNKLESAGLKVGEVQFQETADVSPGTIIRTDPAAERKVKPGTRVKLVVAQAPTSTEGETLALPDMANKTAEAAIAALTAAGLTPGEVTYEASSSVSEGMVIRTEPAASTQVAKGTTVKIFVATKPGQQQQGTPPCTVPDLAHKAREYAESELGKAKIRYEVKREESHSVNPGVVIRTDPAAGHYDPCRKVTVYVSKGPPIHVPNVVGMGEQLAISEIQGPGLKASVKRDNYCGPTETKEEEVTAQSPSGGSTAYAGDTVTITIPKYTGACASAKTG